MFRTHFVTDDDYEEDTMKNKKFIALLAMTVALSGVMTACSFGGGKEDSVVVESTPTPTPAKKRRLHRLLQQTHRIQPIHPRINL